MGKYTDDEIRAMKKITVKIAADYLGISHTMVTLGMRNNLLPIGFATKDESTYGGHGWTYVIVPERLIAYNHGKINEVQVERIEDNLQKIVNSSEICITKNDPRLLMKRLRIFVSIFHAVFLI